ncbi:ATP-binding cassette domain-containing protein [Lactococcus lactis]|nr:ATP-binding cassette domain-containing protein [Lactococcus lactis]
MTKKKFFKANNQTFDFWSLRNVNLNVYDGECIGIIGLNGAGKSTLVNLISETISPTTGNLQVNGEVSTISIGAGLQNGITGRENIRLKSLMMGMSNKEIDEQMDEIIAFSELGPFIDELVKNYSSGMKSKLGFSIAVYQNPDILIIDEALSVGDSTFAEKSSKKMFEFSTTKKDNICSISRH